MKKVRQGTLKKVLWKARCKDCGSTFEEEVGKLHVQSDRDGQLAEGKCPDCHTTMWFYPRSDRTARLISGGH